MEGAAIGGVIAFLVVCLVAFYFIRKSSTEKASASDTKRIIKGEQTPKELEDELRDLKVRIGNAGEKDPDEEYRMYEGYMAPGNPGLTVAGTILECMLDVAVAILAQENTRKLAKGFIKDEKDAEVVATGMRRFADDAIELIGKTNFVTCDGPDEDPCKTSKLNQGAVEAVFQDLMNRSVEKTLVTPETKDALANIYIQQQKRLGIAPTDKKELLREIDGEWSRLSSNDRGKDIEPDEPEA
jgi:hypothetical protein